MQLIIKEYLSQLKESKELDELLPALLLSMKHIPITTPQIGVRQYGVDIVTEFTNRDNKKILYVFVIKKGDIGRSNWDSSPQSIRQTLNEIKDVYFNKIINIEQKQLTKKIILCTNGILKQEIEISWNSYIETNTVINNIEYELWNGYQLAHIIEKYMLNEFILLGNFKSLLRKTLALLGDSDYNLSDYYTILKDNLLITEKNRKKSKRLLFSIRLILNIIYNWSKENNNLKPALLAAERTILNTWEYLKINNFIDNLEIIKIFDLLFQDFVRIHLEYFLKIEPFCYLKNGISDNSRYYLLENINLYEQLGIIAIAGLNHFYFGSIYNNEDIIIISKRMKNTLKEFINNHPSISSPVYDNHINEIVLAIILLRHFGEIEFIEKWILEIIHRIDFSYNVLKKYFPIDSDSLEDAVLISNSTNEDKEKMMRTSTLLMILLQISAILKFDNIYKYIFNIVNKSFKNTTLQIWFPDITTDNYLYSENAGYTSGIAFLPHPLPENIYEMNKIIVESYNKYMDKDTISAIKKGFLILPLIASRHFRTPILPIYWSILLHDLQKKNNHEN